jgi:hypothetical protein
MGWNIGFHKSCRKVVKKPVETSLYAGKAETGVPEDYPGLWDGEGGYYSSYASSNSLGSFRDAEYRELTG